MNAENDVLIINKQKLIQAVIELERQETLQSCLLYHCLDQLEDILRKLNLVLQNNQTGIARNAFLQVLMSDIEWEKVLTDQQIIDWQDEGRQKFEQITLQATK